MEKTTWMKFKTDETWTPMYPIPNDSDLTHASEDFRSAALSDARRLRALTPEQYERALVDRSECIRMKAVTMARHADISLTPEQYERALTDKKSNVRFRAVCLARPVNKYWEDLPGMGGAPIVVHKLTAAQKERALMDADPEVRSVASKIECQAT